MEQEGPVAEEAEESNLQIISLFLFAEVTYWSVSASENRSP